MIGWDAYGRCGNLLEDLDVWLAENLQMAKTHRDLLAWQLSMELVEFVYLISDSFPSREKFGLVSQMRRAAISVPSNIAEGAARNTSKQFLQFLFIARGSLAELQTQLELAKRLGFTSTDTECHDQTKRLFAILAGLINQVQSQLPNHPIT